MPAHIVALSGSLRANSWNTKLVHAAGESARAAGASVSFLDLRELALPVFDEDLEGRSTPEGAKRLKAALAPADGLLIASPEYNSSLTAALKNAIDWASRPAAGEPSLVAFQGKVAGLMAASPGALGGLRGLVHLRAILSNIGVIVLPEQFALAKAHEAFASDGSLVNPDQKKAVDRIAGRVVTVASKLKAG